VRATQRDADLASASLQRGCPAAHQRDEQRNENSGSDDWARQGTLEAG
jgi:hypothetical protein